jgi:hypothetical protein
VGDGIQVSKEGRVCGCPDREGMKEWKGCRQPVHFWDREDVAEYVKFA